jgi:signal transduction histidine kinase
MDIISSAAFTIALGYIALAIYLSTRKKEEDSAKSRYLGLILLSSAIWTSTLYITLKNFLSGENLFLMSKVPHAAALWVLYYIIRFSLSFKQTITKRLRIFNSAILTSLLIVSALTLFTNLITKGVNVKPITNDYHYGELYNLYSLYVGVLIFSIFTLMIRIHKRLRGLEKLQFSYVSIGISISILFIVSTNLIIPVIKASSKTSIYGPFGTLSLIAFLYYTVLKHRFLSIASFFNRIIYVIIGTATLYSLFYGLIFFYLKVFGSLYTAPVYIIGVVVGIICTLLIRLLFIKLDNTRFIKKKFDAQDYINLLRTKTYIGVSTKAIINDFIEITKPGFGIASIFDITKEEIDDKEYKKYKKFYRYLAKRKSDRQRKIYIYQEDKKIFHKNDLHDEVSALIPIYHNSKLLHLIVLGNRVNHSAYDQEDINVITEAAERINLAVARNVLNDEQQRFNEVLKDKLDVATARLRKQKKQIEEKYQYEKDMIGIMGHELRTPMTVAKGFVELIIKAAKNNTINTEDVMEKANKIHDSILKEADIIETMLSTSHVENNKIALQITPTNVTELLDYSYNAFFKMAEDKQLTLIYNKPNYEIPSIDTDPNRLQEILNNLVSNAVKYTREGHVDINIELVKDRVKISVVDTGIGIPKDEIEKLGRKFYRVNQYLDSKDRVRPGGTGLGLYVVKGLVNALKGELEIESELGEGSKFSVLLPLDAHFKEGEDTIILSKRQDQYDMFAQMGLKK